MSEVAPHPSAVVESTLAAVGAVPVRTGEVAARVRAGGERVTDATVLARLKRLRDLGLVVEVVVGSPHRRRPVSGWVRVESEE